MKFLKGQKNKIKIFLLLLLIFVILAAVSKNIFLVMLFVPLALMDKVGLPVFGPGSCGGSYLCFLEPNIFGLVLLGLFYLFLIYLFSVGISKFLERIAKD